MTDQTRPSAPTLADVARHAGVSSATVSRCLNSPDQVVGQTREKVMRAVAELGYAPNFSAQALAARRTNTIGAVVPTIENAIFARGLQAFQEELGRHGFTLLIASSSYDAEREAEQIRTLAARGADGLLLIGFDRDPKAREFLTQRTMPALVAWAYDPDASYPSIGFDNAEGMALVAREALAGGHRHFAAISAPTAENDRARGRVEGIRRAMAEAGLDPASLAVVETPYGFDTGEAAFHRLMARNPRPTAVLCGNDVLALGAMRAARSLGLSVPGDVSITGFDDTELATLAEPALTSVHVPHGEMGRRAATMLIDMVRGGARPDSVLLPTQLQLRGTLRPTGLRL